MNRNIKKIFTNLIIVLLLIPSLALSQNNEETQDSKGLQDAFGPGSTVEEIAGESGYQIDSTENGVIINELIATIINTLLSVLGVIFVILTIVSGFRWMTASGNQEQVNKAKASLKQNVIGLLIIVISWGIWGLILRVINQF